MHCCFSQVVLSHAPYRELAKDLGDKPVVISGRGASEVAQAYGFTRAVTTSQLSAAHPTAVPFCHDPGLPAISCYMCRRNQCCQHLIYVLLQPSLPALDICGIAVKVGCKLPYVLHAVAAICTLHCFSLWLSW